MLIKICKLILFSKEMLEQHIRPCASEQGFPRSHPTSSHNLNKTIPQMSFYIAYKHQGRCACCINITFLTIQNRQWQNTKPQTHSMTVMYAFKCLVHSEGPWLQPVALQDSRWAESQKLSLSTTLRLCNCRKIHGTHGTSWTFLENLTQIQTHYTPFWKQGSWKPNSNRNNLSPALAPSSPPKHRGGWLCWKSRRLKSTSYLTDLLLYCAFVHMVTTNHLLLTLPKRTLCLWTKLFRYPLLQLSLLAHFYQNKWQVKSDL